MLTALKNNANIKLAQKMMLKKLRGGEVILMEPNHPDDFWKLLDECVKEAREAERTGDWTKADEAAGKLNDQAKIACMVAIFNVMVNAIAVFSSATQGNYIVTGVSIGAIAGSVLQLYQAWIKK